MKPYVVCHMLTSIDGKIDGSFFSAPECVPALHKFAEVREFYRCTAVVYGTTTMEGGYSGGIIDDLPRSGKIYPREDYAYESGAESYIVSLDPKGTLAFDSNFIKKPNRPSAHIIEVLTDQATDDYVAYLRSCDISYIFAGKDRFDCAAMLEKLNRLFGIKRLMISGGGITNLSFLQENLIDELSLVIAPVADGGRGASIFDRADFLPYNDAVPFELINAQSSDAGTLWLTYRKKGGAGV